MGNIQNQMPNCTEYLVITHLESNFKNELMMRNEMNDGKALDLLQKKKPEPSLML